MIRAAAPLRAALIFALCVALFEGCNREHMTKATPLPASYEVAGWAQTGDVRSFEAPNLWKYIDGEAERYLKAGVQRVFTADYRFQNKIDVVVDVYTMGNADGAASILDSEPTSDAKSVPLGDSARLYGESLVFREKSYLVRIVAYQESAEVAPALLQLGQGIERRLKR